MVNEYFKKYSEWVVSVTYNKGFSVIQLNIKDSWDVVESMVEKNDYFNLNINLEYSPPNSNSQKKTVIIYAEGFVFDELMRMIDKEIIEYNVNKEMKKELYIKKKKELLSLFNTKTIEELKNLELIVDNNIKIVEQNKKEEDVTTEEKL